MVNSFATRPLRGTKKSGNTCLMIGNYSSVFFLYTSTRHGNIVLVNYEVPCSYSISILLAAAMQKINSISKKKYEVFWTTPYVSPSFYFDCYYSLNIG